jgi:predicted AAA+ superfamily ATPase
MNNIINLSFINKLKAKIDNKSDLIQVLLGPRQVGKTTTVLKLIEEHYKETSIYVSADDVFNAESNWLREQWQEAQRKNKILFIDEIQKSYNWSDTIKTLYDESKKNRRPVKCVLLGSSSLEIHKGLSESLTGRFQLTYAYHWNYQESELGYGVNFEDYLRYGGYPGSYKFIKTNDWVDYVKNSIISTVIEKDILQYSTVKNPALFKQAFEIMISYPAQEISYTKILGQLQDKGNVELVKYYLHLFEGAFLIKGLEKFSNKALKTRSSSPKILPMAPCMPYLQIRDTYTPDELGRIFELLVGTQLVRTNEELYYWREGAYEVDYVLKSGRKIFAIEVKSGRKKSVHGLTRFKLNFPTSKTILISRDNYTEFEKDPISFLEVNSA